jgi:hypothetical protein
MHEEALPPTFPTPSLPKFIKEVRANTTAEGDANTRKLASLALDERYQLLERLIKAEVERIGSLMEIQIDGNEDMSDLGTRFMIARIVAEELSKVVQWVQDANFATNQATINSKETL